MTAMSELHEFLDGMNLWLLALAVCVTLAAVLYVHADRWLDRHRSASPGEQLVEEIETWLQETSR